jgi:hypothetical protein
MNTARSKSMKTMMLRGLAAAMAGCGIGSAGAGTMIVAVEPVRPAALTVAGATVTLTRALLSVEAVEVVGGEGATRHTHEGEGHGEAPATGELRAVTPGAVVDLLGSEVELLNRTDATAGEYLKVFVSVAPAEEGAAAGKTLLLEGTAAGTGGTRSFVVQWAEEADDFVAADVDVHIDRDGSTEVLVKLDVAKVFEGVDLFAAAADGGTVTVNATTNATVLQQFRTNLAGAFSVTSAHAH